MNTTELLEHVKSEAQQWKEYTGEPSEYALARMEINEATLKALERLAYLEEIWNREA